MKKILTVLVSLTSAGIFAYGTGVSTRPIEYGKRMVSTEFTGITSNDGGMGFQARYSQKVAKNVIVDGGIGISDGDRAQRYFFGADLEVYPDYMRQPRVSIKSSIERATEFGITKTVLSVAPVVSKGISFWGHEAFPYASIPLGLSLNSGHGTYFGTASLNTGINGQIPLEGYNHLIGNLELQVGLKNSFTAVLASIIFSLN